MFYYTNDLLAALANECNLNTHRIYIVSDKTPIDFPLLSRAFIERCCFGDSDCQPSVRRNYQLVVKWALIKPDQNQQTTWVACNN